MTAAVSCRDLVVGYDGRTVIEGISLDLAPGAWLTLIGPNGAGKTTLLRALSGSLPVAGRRWLTGEPIERLSRRQLARLVAVVPQTPAMPDGMTVLDYVLLGRTPHISYWSTETGADVTVARRTLVRLDLSGFSDRPLGTLSGGERQRAVLARALAQGAPVLFLDEPTASLDVGHQQQVLELVDLLRREEGIAVLSAMHDLTLAGQYAGRLLLMDGGRVVAEGSAREVLDPSVISTHYGARVVVVDGPGGPVVVPQRPVSRPEQISGG